jgi:hypothetical protein
MWHVFPRGLRSFFQPSFTSVPPHFNHQETTFCTPFFAKTPAKRELHHTRKKMGGTIGAFDYFPIFVSIAGVDFNSLALCSTARITRSRFPPYIFLISLAE